MQGLRDESKTLLLQLKVKRDYGDLGDSLDVVPIGEAASCGTLFLNTLLISWFPGAWHGQGRKAGWWSPILLAVYDPDTETFQALCKVCVLRSSQLMTAEMCCSVSPASRTPSTSEPEYSRSSRQES